MAERERRAASAGRGRFVPRAQVLSASDVRRALARIAHEVLERNRGLDELAVIGLQTGGASLARRLAAALEEIGQGTVPLGSLDVAWYRDDLRLRPVVPAAPSEIPFDVTGRVVILFDDVLYTGRTVRAALDALSDLGRPKAVQLAVMIDRGHRELPIRPDYVGKNLPTRRDELVDVTDEGVWLGEVSAR
ncbi:MAG: bifunctional pyr operon transcriptional regulator/uracil phosphoribosyltransferase PyrR [Acidimicrobiales bacterium]